MFPKGEHPTNLDEEDEWDLKLEKVEIGTELTDRLKIKIKNNFKRFVQTYKIKAHSKEARRQRGKRDEDDERDDDDDDASLHLYKVRLKDMCRDGRRMLLVSICQRDILYLEWFSLCAAAGGENCCLSGHIFSDFQHLYSTPECANLAWWVSQTPAKILPVLQEAAKEMCLDLYETFNRDTEEEDVHIAFEGFPVTDPIRKLRNENLNQLVTCDAVVTRRTQVIDRHRS